MGWTTTIAMAGALSTAEQGIPPEEPLNEQSQQSSMLNMGLLSQVDWCELNFAGRTKFARQSSSLC